MGNLLSLKNNNNSNLTYENIKNLIKNKLELVEEFKPTCILAIGSGGLIPSKILKSFLNLPIYVITISAYEGQQLKENVEIIQWITKNLSNERVLIVDDIDDTRTTLQFCLNKLKLENNLNVYKIFVIHNKIKKKVISIDIDNYIACETIEDIWINYPWE